MFTDLEKLSRLTTVTDVLVRSLGHIPCAKFRKNVPGLPTVSYVTLDLVKDDTAKKMAYRYVQELIANKQTLGILYHLFDLTGQSYVRLNANLLIDLQKQQEIIDNLQCMAQNFFCPKLHGAYFDITCMELFYFFALCVNPHLNWVTIDYINQCNQWHQYFIVAPNRLVR